MDTLLRIEKYTKDKYRFILKFENNEDNSIELPIDRLENSAAMVGIILEVNDKQLEPASFRVVSKKTYNNIIVEPGEHVSFELISCIKNNGKKHYLAFNNASYEIIPGKDYKVWFSLNGYVSKPVKFIFDSN